MFLLTGRVFAVMLVHCITDAASKKERVRKSEEVIFQNTTAVYEYLSKHYDRHTAPFNSSKPVQLTMELSVESFDSIEEASMGFSLYIYIIQKWFDHRLKNVVNVTTVMIGKDINLIWTPDTYCLNARESDLMLPDEQAHSMVRLEKTGHIMYSRGSYLKTSCMMDLRDFPMDIQHCSVHFSSCNFTTLTATFEFKRRLGYYMLQIYIPCSFLVMLSWIAFWMDKRDTGNRLTVGVTTILTIMFLLGYSNSSVPKMSYVKAMDVYLLSSFAFIFFSLVETVMSWRIDNDPEDNEVDKAFLNRSDSFESSIANEGNHLRANSRSLGDNCGAKPPPSSSDIDEILLQKIGRCLDRLQTAHRPAPTENNSTNITKPPAKPSRVQLDTMARIFFPLAYVIFNIIYWSVWPMEL